MLGDQFAFSPRHVILLCLCVVLAWCPTASAQVTGPSSSNVTLPPEQQFVLIPARSSATIRLDPLTPSASAAGIVLTGRLIATDSAQDAEANLKEGDISLISCDPDSYPGPLAAAGTINESISKNPIAIVLYSTTAVQCSFNSTDGFTYTSMYTTVTQQLSSAVQAVQSDSAKIMLFSRSDNTTSDTSFTKSPTTAVAMIILYSITGIITALFLIIIVVGAIRAHRHPERYGPRHVIGRPRQSRAKGIARAMLETLPIVKFGDKDDDKPIGAAGDVELGTTEGAHPNSSAPAPETEAPVANDSVHNGEVNSEPEMVKTETVDGTNESERQKTEDGTNADDGLACHTDNGLACSVCTDDFVKGQDIRVLPCNHKFHPECIDPWLLNVSGTCPLCRVDLRPTTNLPTDPDFPESSHNTSTHSHTHFDAHDSGSAALPASTELPASTVPPASTVLPASTVPPASTVLPASSTNAATGTSTPPTTTDPTPHPNRRSRHGLSSFLQSTLNRRSMRDATPEERIQALRTVRTANRAEESESAGSIEQRPRNRMSARLSRAFNPASSPSSGAPVPPSQPVPNSADVPEREG